MGLVKNIIYKIALPAFAPLIKKRTIFPYYHLVNDKKVPHINNLYAYKNVAAFKKDIAYLKAQYKPISPEDLIVPKGKPSIPNNHFLLTFDDGLSEIYTTIYPILKANNLKAIFFLNPDFIDNQKSLYKHDLSVIVDYIKTEEITGQTLQSIIKKLQLSSPSHEELTKNILQIKHQDKALIEEIARMLEINLPEYLEKQKPYLTEVQIREMIADGFYFGGHTMSHPRLTELSLEQQKEEVLNSIKWVKERFGLTYSLFAFPFSDKGITKALINAVFDYDSQALIFGNSGFRKDINPRLIHRFSLEDPSQNTVRRIITENIYLLFNKLIGKYTVKRA